MLVGLKQINNYLINRVTLDELVEIIGRTEIEIEQIKEPVAYDKNLIVVEILSVSPHPNADRLQIAVVDTGKARLEIVCGAPNVAKFQKVVLAQVGTTLPDGGKIGKSKIRGVISNGMLCSERELGMSHRHDGIYVLDPKIANGTTLCDIANNDYILDIKTPPNRWDYLSLVGLARQIAGADQRVRVNELKNPTEQQKHYNTTKYKFVKQRGEAARFMAVKIRLNNAVKTPTWVVDNLRSSGLESINPVVDFSNFVMLELGQPTHAYDSKKIVGMIGLRSALPGENITTLDGKKRQLSENDLVIADEQKPVALAGVMGGLDSETSSATTEIILEVATFDATRVRRSALAHGMRTEASARLERSLPPVLAQIAIERMIHLLSKYCAAELASPVFDDYRTETLPKYISLSQRRAEKVLGLSIDNKLFGAKGLRRFGFEAKHFSLTQAVSEAITQEKALDQLGLLNNIFEQLDLSFDAKTLFSDKFPLVDSDQIKAGDIIVHGTKPNRLGGLGVVLGVKEVIFLTKTGGVESMTVRETTGHKDYLHTIRPLPSYNHIYSIKPPWWRADVRVGEDVIEELAKLIGYDNIPLRLPDLPATATTEHQLLPKVGQLKQRLVSLGLYEVMSYAFVSGNMLKAVGARLDDHLRIHNPLTVEQEYLRSDLLASHLRTLSVNQNSLDESIGFFEISHIYHAKQTTELPDEKTVVGILANGEAGIWQVKQAITTVVGQFSSDLYYRSLSSEPAGITGRCYKIELFGKVIGSIYQVKPTILNKFDIRSEVSYGLVDLTEVLLLQKTIQAQDVPAYQLASRDINIEISDTVMWQSVRDCLKEAKSIFAVEFLSSFVDKTLSEKGRKRLAIRLRFDLGPNPTQADIEKACMLAQSHLKKSLK